MRRRIGTMVAFVAFLALPCPGGEIHHYLWPSRVAQPLPVTEIPVVMDVVVPYQISLTFNTIKLRRMDARTYQRCSRLRVGCNFNLRLDCSITPTGAVGGQFSCSIADPDIDAPGGSRDVCVTLTDATFAGQEPANDVTVAVVTLKIVER